MSIKRKRFLLLSEDGEAANTPQYTYKTESFNSIQRLTCNETSEITELRIIPEERDNATVGYIDTDGKATISIRVHGGCFLDGEEMKRLIRKTGSNVFSITESGDFIFNADSTDAGEIISSNHLELPFETCTMNMIINLTEDYGGANVKSGLYINTRSGTRFDIYAPSVSTGATSFTAQTSSGHTFAGLKYSQGVLKGRYEVPAGSVKLLGAGVAATESYDGYHADIKMSSLLRRLSSECYDELEAVSGVVTRRVGIKTIPEDVEITSVVYEGYSCFAIALPENNASKEVYIGDFSYTENVYDFEWTEEGVVVSPDKKTAYIYSVYCETAEDIRARIAGEDLLYKLKNEFTEQAESKLPTMIGEGRRYIEICGLDYKITELTYREKE